MVNDVKKPNKHLLKLNSFEAIYPNKKGWISPAFQELTDKVLYLTNTKSQITTRRQQHHSPQPLYLTNTNL